MAAVSNRVLKSEGSIGGVLNVALKHFAYVAPRWDSAATPTRDFLQLSTFCKQHKQVHFEPAH